MLLLLPALFVQFVWPLVGLRVPLPMRLYQVWSAGLGLVVALTPGLWLNANLLPVWELSLLPPMVVALAMLVRQGRRGQPEALAVAIGLSVFMLSGLHDVAVDRGLASAPRVATLGFAAFVCSMAISLANRFSRTQAELSALRRNLERRVSERTAELARRTAEAAAANVAKSQFLATMSHEIRTPLNAVIGMTGLLLDSRLTAGQRESLEVVRRSGEGLLHIVNDVLDLSTIESGKLKLDAEPFSLVECIQEVLDLVAAEAGANGLELGWTARGVPPWVTGDVARVRQVLVNLIGNAVKFTPSGGVMVTAQPHDGAAGPSLHVVVADTGIAVPHDRRAVLFSSFSQVDASHSRRYGGSGLGLAISRRLVQLMGGELWIGDEPGPGAVFHFTFQVAIHAGGHAQHEPPPMLGRSVAVIGAGPFTWRTLEAGISSWGASVRALDAGAGVRTTGAVEAETFDAVLIADAAGPEALELVERLRARSGAERMAVIGFGAPAGPEAVTPRMRPAAGAHVTMPLRLRHVHRVLLQAFGDERAAAASSTDPPTAAAPEPAGATLRILLAEDNAVNQKVALLMLEREGYRADVAFNGLEVLRARTAELRRGVPGRADAGDGRPGGGTSHPREVGLAAMVDRADGQRTGLGSGSLPRRGDGRLPRQAAHAG